MTFTDVQKAHCAKHEESEIDCVDCTVAQQNAACDHLTLAQKAEKFKAAKRSASVTTSARPAATQTVTHVAGDVLAHTYRKVQPGEAGFETIATLKALNKWVCDSADHNEPEGCSNPQCFKHGDGKGYTGPNLDSFINARLSGAMPSSGELYESTPLQQPLEGVGPAHLSSATVARGFILAGNAVFTVRSLKTGVRYTYRVSRAECSRCHKKDCQCWKYPTYFVALLTGPDNQGDYTYLGMIRENAFRLTRGSRMLESSKPVLAFRYVWERLAGGEYPAQVEIWHSGRCGRCGRLLTRPESIKLGIGPECAGIMGLGV